MGDTTTAVWLMGGTDGSQFIGALPNSNQVSGWRLVGVADFNHDGIPDILWESKGYPYTPDGTKAIWYMNSSWQIAAASLPSIWLTPAGWTTIAIGDYGKINSSGTAADGVRDGNPDLVLQNFSTLQQAIWILDSGASGVGGFLISDVTGNAVSAEDSEWKIQGAYDYGGYTDSSGPYSDILFRRNDFSDVPVWFLKGNILQGAQWAGPTYPGQTTAPQRPFGTPDIPGFSPDPIWRTVYDQQWKIAGQDLPDPTARLASLATMPSGQMTASITTSSYTVTWNLQPPLAPLTSYPIEYRIRVKKAEDTPWTTLATLPNSPQISSYSGNYSFAADQRYDFNVSLYQENGSVKKAVVAQSSVAINAQPLENRGNVLLLIDQDLQSNYGSQMNQIVSDLTKDLTGDGWKVQTATAARHIDNYTQSGFLPNYNQLAGIKATINSAYNSGARSVLIIGHVVIPYSGYFNPDGHDYRAGPADLRYGDLDGVWLDADNIHIATSGDFSAEEYQFGAGDGRMDPSAIPPLADGVTHNGLELSVGRVDFARMPSPNDTMQAEVNLISAYFAKARKYRLGNPPYPIAERAAAWSWAAGFTPEAIVGRFRSVLGSDPSLIVSANSLMQQSAAYLLGFTGGKSDYSLNSAAYGYEAFSPANLQSIVLWHRPEDFLVAGRVPKIAINFIFCSHWWDWNLPNSFLKALLAAQDYGVAAIWDEGLWQMQPLALGETLGATQMRNVQMYTGIRTEHPGVSISTQGFINQSADGTYFAIMGDPTLRLHYLRPPPSANVQGTTVTWTATPDQSISQYLVYYKDASSGLYVRVQNSSQPVACCSVTLTTSESQSSSFMVRATKTITAGAGSYRGLSQGAFYPPL